VLLAGLNRGIEWPLRACEVYASSVFIFASTNSDQICLESSERLRKYKWQALRKFSTGRNLSFIKMKRSFAPGGLTIISSFGFDDRQTGFTLID